MMRQMQQTNPSADEAVSLPRPPKPRVAFAGLGWIGMNRLQAVRETGLIDIAGIADNDPGRLREATDLLEDVPAVERFEDLLADDVDGVVIATPSGMHADQAVAALDRGAAVFCQKPLARDAAETQQVIEAARRAERLLAVDFSYRHICGIDAAREMIRSGGLGRVYLAELTFHNAYGPDKPWFYRRSFSGGGCVLDLGTHLIDLAMWMLDEPKFLELRSRLWYGGSASPPTEDAVEDAAVADWQTPGGTNVRIACSWRLHAGQQAVISAVFYGTEAAVRLRNLNGSFYDFTVERCVGTTAEPLAAPDADWGGRAINAWANRLASDCSFDPAINSATDVAQLIDGVYGR